MIISLMTIIAKLVASESDSFGYITYVFKCLDNSLKESPYVMCVRYPNWNHRKINLGDKGYLSFIEIKAGEDTWFDGKNMIPYNYNAIQFLKFVDIKETSDKEYIM